MATESRTSEDATPAVGGVSRPRVLTLLNTYLPGYKSGGPLRSIENLVAALGEEFEFRIITSDRDLGEKSPFPGVVTDRWVQVGQAAVMYLRPGLRGLLGMWTQLRAVDQDTVLYINSVCERRSSMLPMFMRWLGLCRPRRLVLAPRGEFALGALRLKRMRKLAYLGISRWLGVYQNLVWHATSAFEAADIRRQFPRARQIDVAAILPHADERDKKESEVALASDIGGSVAPNHQDRPVKTPGRLRAVFIARCARMKNLSGALRLLAGVRGDVSFDIYGPVEDAKYWEECQRLIASLPPNIRVRHEGGIEHERVGQIFAEYDLFLFPTLGENYGHVICEALASGCPVLISDRTPWRDLEKEGVGWDLPLGEPERFRSVLQQCVDGADEWFSALSKRAKVYAAKRSAAPETINANRTLFLKAFTSPSLGPALSSVITRDSPI